MTKPQNKPKQFRVGDVVEWTSQANGTYRTKVGIVMDIIRDGYSPYNRYGLNKDRDDFRDHDSYIVGIPHVGKQMEYFWPRVKHLQPYKQHLMSVR